VTLIWGKCEVHAWTNRINGGTGPFPTGSRVGTKLKISSEIRETKSSKYWLQEKKKNTRLWLRYYIGRSIIIVWWSQIVVERMCNRIRWWSNNGRCCQIMIYGKKKSSFSILVFVTRSILGLPGFIDATVVSRRPATSRLSIFQEWIRDSLLSHSNHGGWDVT
jgi:hypothetical protein